MATRGKAHERMLSDDAEALLKNPAWQEVQRRFEEALVLALSRCETEHDAWKLTCVLKAGRMQRTILEGMARSADVEARHEVLRKAVA